MLNQEPKGQWTTVPISNVLQSVMFKVSTVALMGSRIMDLNPEFINVYWDYDGAFLLGLPNPLYPEGGSASDKFLAVVRSYIDSGHDRCG